MNGLKLYIKIRKLYKRNKENSKEIKLYIKYKKKWEDWEWKTMNRPKTSKWLTTL